MSEFHYQAILPAPSAGQGASFRKLGPDGVAVRHCGDRRLLEVSASALEQLAYEAFRDMAFFFPSHVLEQWATIARDADAGQNERFVAGTLLANAIISAQEVLPACQDTGVAEIIGFRGRDVLTTCDEAAALSRGAFNAYNLHNLRQSLVAATDMFNEANTGDNMPAQVEIFADDSAACNFVFIAKGGGSSNKTSLSQESKAVLEGPAMESLLRERLSRIGVAACPPYHVGIAIGGTSPEQALKTAKLASLGLYDSLPRTGDGRGGAFRCPQWEEKVLEIMQSLGLGAQFGGRHMATDARVIRLPRHSASCSVAISVSCSAHRVICGRIDTDGVWLEELDRQPERFADLAADAGAAGAAEIRLDVPMGEIITQLSSCRAGDRIRLSGPLVVARDIAHQRIKAEFDRTCKLPDYFRNHPVYYAGPAKTPPTMASGSLGPTTAQRMDPYMETFMANGACLVTLGKGNRHPSVSESCRRHKGCFLGTIGGAAAILAKNHVLSSEIIDYPELGMEAVRLITVRDLPAFVIIDAEGNSIY